MMIDCKVIDFLRKIIHEYTAVDEVEIKENTNFQDYGINSFMMLEMIRDIEQQLGVHLSKTLFFEYENLRELSEFFNQNYSDKFKIHNKLESLGNSYLLDDSLF